MSKKAYARPDYKVKPLTLVIVTIIVFVFAALIVVLIPSDKEKIYNAYNSAGAVNLSEDHVFESITVSSLIKVIDSGDPVVVFFGASSCSVCVTEISYYDQHFKDQGLEASIGVIYYLDSTKISDSSIATLQSKYGMTLSGTPEVYYFNSGTIQDKRANYTASTQAAQIRDFFEAIAADLA